MPRSNAETVRSFYAALGRADLGDLLGLLHEELEWTEAERFPYYGGTWRSPRAVVDNLLLPLARDWDPFRAEAEEFLSVGDQVVSFGFYAGRYKATGRSMTARFAHRWLLRDGRIARFEMYADTAKVLEAMSHIAM